MKQTDPANAKTPPATRRRAARLSPDERKRQLAEAALLVLAEEGLGHTNHSMVAARAGVSLPTMLHYYPQHADLVDTVLDGVADFLLNGIAGRVAATVGDPALATEEMLVAFALSIETNQDMVRVWLDWSTATRHSTWPKYLAFRTNACAIVARLLRRGQAEGVIHAALVVDEAAQVVVGLAHMTAQMYFTGSSPGQIRRAVHELLEGYLRSKRLPAAG
ncbi:TetR/AcrR family transcriptional regulator [Novosphingobium sp. BL-52-GroH]|uniref:TetR/AcrR family transcriptional regulator n=1 Tax=Novosphingobium sp. BL-52-GroH TaxID=3349877 RepID=UPI00384D1754